MLGSAHLSPLQLHSPSPNQPAAGDELPTAKGQGLIRRKNSLKMFSTLDRDQKTAEMEAAEATAERKQKLEQHVIEAEKRAQQQQDAQARIKAQKRLANERLRSVRRRSESETSLEVPAFAGTESVEANAGPGIAPGGRNSATRKSAKRNLPNPSAGSLNNLASSIIEEFEFVVNRGKNPLGFSIKQTESSPYSLAVDKLKPSSAAQVAGVLREDYVLSVDDTDTGAMSKPDAMAILRAAGEVVVLKIGRVQKSRRASFRRASSNTDINRLRASSVSSLQRPQNIRGSAGNISRGGLTRSSGGGSMRALPTPNKPKEEPTAALIPPKPLGFDEPSALQATELPKAVPAAPEPALDPFAAFANSRPVSEPPAANGRPISLSQADAYSGSDDSETETVPADAAPPAASTPLVNVQSAHSLQQQQGQAEEQVASLVPPPEVQPAKNVFSFDMSIGESSTDEGAPPKPAAGTPPADTGTPAALGVKPDMENLVVPGTPDILAAMAAKVVMRGGGDRRKLQENVSRASVLWNDDTAAVMRASLPNAAAGELESSRAAQYQRLIAELSKHDFAGFKREWQELLLVGQKLMSVESEDPMNSTKNRYSNIKAYDATRVKLEVVDNVPHSDYVNANFVEASTGGTKYIATQGPQPQTFESFWRMVWEANSTVIVMLTKEIENSRTKCDRYWPDPTQPQLAYGDIIVSIERTANAEFHVVRHLTLQRNGETRSVTQFCYTGWPEQGNPEDTTGLLEFQREVKSVKRTAENPVLVHCSAGVGRTGVFIAADTLDREEQRKSGQASVFDAVKSMRMCRTQMVQSLHQYIYLYKLHAGILERGESEEASQGDGSEMPTLTRSASNNTSTKSTGSTRENTKAPESTEQDAKFERLRIHIPDPESPIHYTTILVSPGMTASEIVTATIRRLPAIHTVPRRQQLVRLTKDGDGVEKRFADQDPIGVFEQDATFELQPKMEVADVCLVTVNVGILHVETASVELKVRDETKASEMVALALARTSSSHPADNYAIQVAAGPRGGKRFLKPNERMLDQPMTTCVLASRSEAQGGAPSEVVDALKSQADMHKKSATEHKDKFLRLKTSYNAAQTKLISMQTLDAECNRLRDEIAKIQGQAATDKKKLEFEVTEARRSSMEQAAAVTEQAGAAEAALQETRGQVGQLARDNERLRYYEKRVGVIEETNATLHARMKKQDRMDKDMRQGYDKLYSDKAKRDGPARAAVATLKSSLQGKEAAIGLLQDEYRSLVAELTKARLANAHFEVLLKLQKDTLPDLPSSALEELAAGQALASQIASVEGELHEAKHQLQELNNAPKVVEVKTKQADFVALCDGGRVIRSVTLEKGAGGIGISLVFQEGDDKASPRAGIYVKGVKPGSVAQVEGVLGGLTDQVLEVNGISMVGKSKAEALAILKETVSPVKIAFARDDAGAAAPLAKEVQEKHDALAEELKAAQEKIAQLGKAKSRLLADRASSAGGSKAAQEAVKQMEEQMADLRSQLTVAQDAQRDSASALAATESKLLATETKLVTTAKSLLQKEESVASSAASSAELVTAKDSIADLTSELEMKRREYNDAMVAEKESRDALGEMEEAVAHLRGEAGTYQHQLDDTRKQLAGVTTDAEKKLAELKSKFEASEADLKSELEQMRSQISDLSGAEQSQKQAHENERSQLSLALAAAEKLHAQATADHEVLLVQHSKINGEHAELLSSKSTDGDTTESLRQELEAQQSKVEIQRGEIETLQQVLEDQASGRSEQIQMLRRQLEEQKEHFAVERVSLQGAVAGQRGQFEQMFAQAAAESETRHQQVDAQNAQLRTMLEASKQHASQQQAELQTRMTMLQAMQAERDHLSKAMRQQLAQSMRKPIMSTQDDDSDEDQDELKESLEAKTTEANKLQTLVDQLSDLIKDRAPELLQDVDAKFLRVLGRQRSRAASFRRSSRKAKSGSLRSDVGGRRPRSVLTRDDSDSD